MTKKDFNQNAKFEQELISTIEPDFNFSEKPQNRINSQQNNNAQAILDKAEQLSELKKKINSIENCNLKNNSKNLMKYITKEGSYEIKSNIPKNIEILINNCIFKNSFNKPYDDSKNT